MKAMHRINALALAACLGAVMLTGCGNEGVNIAEEDLPYGATMREAKTTYALPVSYDRRFINDAQLTVLTDYLSAIQTCDGAAYAENTLDFYVDYQVGTVYKDSISSADELMTVLHDGIAEMTAADFEFVMVTVDDFTQERVTTGLGTMLEVLSDISGDAAFMDSVDNCWAVEMEWLLRYDGGGSSVLISEQLVYMFEVDGEYFCVM